MSLDANFNYNKQIPNLNIINSITVGSSQITNKIVNNSTIGKLINTGSLLSSGNSNTIGNLFTTGGNVGIGTTSPTNLLSVNGSMSITNLIGNTTTQLANDSIFIGNSSILSNFYIDRASGGSSIVFGFNTPSSLGQCVFQLYNNSTDRNLMLGCFTNDLTKPNSVYIGTGFSNIPAFNYTYSGSGLSLNTNITLLSGGNTIIDTRSGFNASTGYYTIPVTGYYNLSYFIRMQDSTTAANCIKTEYYRSGVKYQVLVSPVQSLDNWISSDGWSVAGRKCTSYCDLIQFNVGDQVYITADGYTPFLFIRLDFGIYLVTIS